MSALKGSSEKQKNMQLRTCGRRLAGGVAAVAATAGRGRVGGRDREREGRREGSRGSRIEMSIETMRRPLPSDQIGNMLRPTSYEPTKRCSGGGRPTVHSV